MSKNGPETVMRLVDAFEREHAEYAEQLDKHVLRRFLEQTYAEVLRGENRAKTEERLDKESRAAGIKKSDYEALVNLVTHAATDQPIQK
jgi:hypothetical protein